MQEGLQDANYSTSKNDLICVIQYWKLMKTFFIHSTVVRDLFEPNIHSSLHAAVTHSICRAERKALSTAHVQLSGEGD